MTDKAEYGESIFTLAFRTWRKFRLLEKESNIRRAAGEDIGDHCEDAMARYKIRKSKGMVK